jgi:DNA invertase Pin-like site-specific DNA recombinase
LCIYNQVGFDVLVVYFSDRIGRIGRIADETPLVISFFNSHNVSVRSVAEGEIKSKTYNDKLTTYLRYWQNEEKSIKLSKRISELYQGSYALVLF